MNEEQIFAWKQVRNVTYSEPRLPSEFEGRSLQSVEPGDVYYVKVTRATRAQWKAEMDYLTDFCGIFREELLQEYPFLNLQDMVSEGIYMLEEMEPDLYTVLPEGCIESEGQMFTNVGELYYKYDIKVYTDPDGVQWVSEDSFLWPKVVCVCRSKTSTR